MPDNIQGQGAPLSSTVGEIGCVYTDTSTDKKYECISIHRYTTMKGPVVSYIWEVVEEEEGGKDSVLGELVVTENGVYDEPVIEGGLETIAWDGVIGDRVTASSGGSAIFVKVSDKILSKDQLVGSVATMDVGMVFTLEENAVMVSGPFVMGYPAVASTSEANASFNGVITLPEPGTYLAYMTDTNNYFQSLTFAGAPTPADGWNKVTVNVTGNSDEPNGKPIVVATSADMDAILANATDADVGEFYLYQGETTETYTNGAVYSIQKEDS